MDIQRGKEVRRKKLIRRIVIFSLILIAVSAITLGALRLQPAVPSVEHGTVWPDTVKRGPMLRQVRGLGTLVPTDVLWIPATSEGRVENIYVKPGATVAPDTILMELSNPDLQLAAVDAEFQVKAAEAGYIDLRVQLESKGLDQQSVAAQVRSDYNQAQLQADRDVQLADAGLIPDLQKKLAVEKARELGTRHELEVKRANIVNDSVQAQLAAQKVKIEQLRALYALKKQQVDQLKVRAGAAGVVQSLGAGVTTAAGTAPQQLEVGQRVAAGAILAKIVQPTRLMAELKVTETEAKDVLVGQVASIDTRTGIIPGKVIRIDPAAVNGTVTVDVALTGALPNGARPDLNVDGTIEIERLTDVLFVGRPVSAQAFSTISLFRYEPDGKTAVRTQVKLGRISVTTVEILDGLRVGDQVILSDMSASDAHDKIRVN